MSFPMFSALIASLIYLNVPPSLSNPPSGPREQHDYLKRVDWFGDKQMSLDLCNQDANQSISVTIATNGFRGTKVEGWYTVDPGRCANLYVWTSDEKAHHLLFRSNGSLVKFSPTEYELFGLRGTGGLSVSGEAYCVNMDGVTDYQSNFLNMGRETSCEGSEELTPFPIKLVGGYDSATVNIPTLSGESTSANRSNELFRGLMSLFGAE
ncbi:DUF1036 domain-containing protein [Aureimonas sp. Leaf454]|uniref:DUF1036 domain-containing protein n=1 Tax=Aureimonas sp. Leaf454 TaxID=1736381 RepID=UPI000AEFC87A|nr:DUF1036 domain-containing protein [Aureimonas sp. Leaf454]